MATDTSSVGSTTGSGSTINRNNLPQQTDAFNNLQIEDFIKLMITELQSQDPLNPMDNSQLLEQISQMQTINSTKKLTTTLDAVLLGQNLANAGSLIGKHVVGLTDTGEDIEGKVESVTIVGNVPRLVIGEGSLSISNVRLILPDDAAAEAED